ncbi:hypothetical protein HMPREF9087_1912 [Enterococcus casseliflavus ATCC 12755]|uniref:Uncharacterized protein n=1 Tax=Enterococcus casseliflavus ATCC 12755 TaxID=888066 RepID=F0EKK6_ENTCA|nr:hypothetical protein HMPREF9087_1912 [Enterococcus casseliflavus ATCC 12755]
MGDKAFRNKHFLQKVTLKTTFFCSNKSQTSGTFQYYPARFLEISLTFQK